MNSLTKSLSLDNAQIFYKNINQIFSEMGQVLDAKCGILVLKEESDSFLEFASFGYSSDFYYSFLVRGNGNFEKIASSSEIVFFDSAKFPLNCDDSVFAAAIRVIYKEEMLGFLLMEFPKKLSLLQSEYIEMVAEKIGIIHALNLKILSSSIQSYTTHERNISYELFDFIFGESIGFANSLKANRFMNIQGSIGSGKKSLVKYIYKKLDLNGKLIILNSLPEQIVKLEKSLQDWVALSGNGILVIENVSGLTMGQQRVFFEFIREPILEPRVYFLDDLTRHKEDYQPFWNLLSQHTVQLPNLLNLDRQMLRSIVDVLFKHLRQVNERNEMSLSEDAYDFFYNFPYKENLRDLRNLLEQAVISSKENIIRKEFYLKINNSKIKSLDFQNEEDLDLRKSVQALERQKILLANKIFSGNQIRMAKALGVSRGSLQYKMKQLEL